MAKNDNSVPAPVTNPTTVPLTIDEFCLRLSTSDKRVELIGAFNYVEKAAGHIKDAEHEYRARFDAFANQPV